MHGNAVARLLAAALALSVVASGCGVADELLDLPRVDAADLEPKLTPQTSTILDAHGNVITTFHGAQDRTVIPIKRMPRHTLAAVIAIEDERFYEHEGVDVRAVGRAAVQNLKSGGVAEGGSTITQQFVKNRILAKDGETERTLARKIDEAALARQVESKQSKQEILERYLNIIYFGNGAYGLQAAAKTHFGIPAKKLSLRQSALLAALIKAPERFDPFKDPKRAKKRRNVVLRKMEELGTIGPKRSRKARSRGLALIDQKKPLVRYDAPYFVDYVKRLLVFHPRFRFLGDSPEERSERLFTAGLRIHTTLVPKQQRAAERAINKVLTQGNDPHASLVAVDPRNGHVKAMVGGRNFFEGRKNQEFSKLNLAIAARPRLGRTSERDAAPGTGRQAGSAFKPFALAAALKKGIPLTRRYAAPACVTFPKANDGKPWEVCNYAGASYGKVDLREATYKSINVAYAKLVLDVGPKPVTRTARSMGIRTPLKAVNSGALGTNPVNPLDMATAYGTLANNGRRHSPVAVTKIVNHAGKRIYKNKTKSSRALAAPIAYAVNDTLKDVIRKGTGTRGRIGRPAAGKTGTAQEYRDAWFIGSVPQLTAAVWVGYPEGSIEMKPTCGSKPKSACRPTRIQVSGGTWPTEIWQSFMTSALKGTPVKDFRKPKRGLETATIDVRTGCPATPKTPARHRSKVLRVEDNAPARGRCRRLLDRLTEEEEERTSSGPNEPKKKKNDQGSSSDSEASSQDEES